MTLSLISKVPSLLILSIKRDLEERRVRRRVRKAQLMINNLPDWQKKDLNLKTEDLMPYKHTM